MTFFRKNTAHTHTYVKPMCICTPQKCTSYILFLPQNLCIDISPQLRSFSLVLSQQDFYIVSLPHSYFSEMQQWQPENWNAHMSLSSPHTLHLRESWLHDTSIHRGVLILQACLISQPYFYIE